MRILLLQAFVFSFITVFGDSFSVFEKDGRFGIKNETGEIAVPAVYERLGWSDGSTEVYDGVIGFKRDKLWGLVSTKNKVLAENKFYTLKPQDKNLLIASIKGRFSNYLFHGIIDTNGEVRISFNYFELEPFNEDFLATEFDQYHSKVGIVSLENRILIPIKYQSIVSENQWFLAGRFDNKVDVYKDNQLVVQNLDSVRIENGLVAFRNGLGGYFNESGIQTHPFEFKNIERTERGIVSTKFPFWEVYDSQNKVLEKHCDSLSYQNNFWTMHLNGVKHKVFPSDEFRLSIEYTLKEVVGNRLLVQHNATGLWSVMDQGGQFIVQNQTLIEASGDHFFCRNESEWNLHNKYGTKVNRFPLQSIVKGVGDHFIAKRNNYWGVIDFNGKSYISFKYDSLKVGGTNFYVAKFHHKWGILDKHGNWRHYPEYEDFNSFGDLIVGRKAQAFSYFNGEQFLYKSTFTITSELAGFFVINGDSNKQGLINTAGTIIAYPSYHEIRSIADFFVLDNGSESDLIDQKGDRVFSGDEEYQDFGTLGEGYITAKRNNKWGFVDLQGRLRISNRYEEVRPFQEDHAAVILRGKWGFIDKGETLKVQPHYDRVSSFQNGLAIVQEQNMFGLINEFGKEIVKVEWASIERTIRGNYIIRRDDGLLGLAGSDGAFILRPNFESIIDFEQKIIVSQNGKKGILDYNGGQLFRINYTEIKSEDKFFLMRQ
jgi:hypothetical protein